MLSTSTKQPNRDECFSECPGTSINKRIRKDRQPFGQTLFGQIGRKALLYFKMRNEGLPPHCGLGAVSPLISSPRRLIIASPPRPPRRVARSNLSFSPDFLS
jgi:hypothetical protein